MSYFKKHITQTRTITVLINADSAEQAEGIWQDSSASINPEEDYPSDIWEDSEMEESNISLASEEELERGMHLSLIEGAI